MVFSFLVFAPWMAAEPISNLPTDTTIRLPDSCPSFIVNHGKYHCFELGTRNQNPIGFCITTLALISSWLFVSISSILGYGFCMPPVDVFMRRKSIRECPQNTPKTLEYYLVYGGLVTIVFLFLIAFILLKS